MEKSRSSSKSLGMHEIQQLPRHQMPATGQSIDPQTSIARHPFQDRGHDNWDQVGYTCHQGRRSKELQIRYLARKFFCLWAKKTFGQVLPSKVRCFYEQKILQKTFGAWKEWWISCRERQLSLRADSHYRHLLHLIFKAWRSFVCQQQGKRNKYYVADSHAKKQKLFRTWQCWLVYVAVRRTKHEMQSVALAFRERSCLRVWWAVWRRRHYQSCTGHKMNALALQHWAQSLQFRAWLQWREMYLCSQKDKQKETRAVAHHQHQELKRCMEAWLGYLNLHRAKKHQNDLAREHRRGRIVWRCFSDWRLSWECRRRMRASQKDVGKLAARITVQRAFVHWKHYVVLCVEETRLCELAENHYKHHLLKLGFKGLWQNVMNTRLQQMRKNLSYRQHQVTVLRKFWNRWKSCLEEKEEQQQQALTSVAHAQYRRVLMRQVFDTWLLKACKQQEYRMGEEKAVLHFERQLLRCFWCIWRRRTVVSLEEQEGLVRATDHYSNLLLLKAFCLWKQNTQKRKTERLKEMQALKFHYSKCLQQSWNKWREYVAHQREKWRKLVQADMHYQHTLLSKTLAAWKSYQCNIKCILYQVAEKEKWRRRRLLRQLLRTWRENALALLCEAKADEHYRRAILSKVLLQWRYTASLQVCCRQQKMAAVVEARKHLDRVHLQTLFLHWRKLTRDSLVLRAQQHRAAQHHQQYLLQKYLLKWKKYHQHCLGKMLLQRQGDQLMTHRLCSASFSCWKIRMLQQQWEKQKTVQALWHWSLSLQRKVFDAWLRVSKGQKQKNDGVEKATEVHHAVLLREGGAWVLRNASGVKQLKGQVGAQCQLKAKEKAAYNLHQSVYRCAMLWKQKVLSKKLHKPCSLLPPLKKQVVFKAPDVSPETRGHSVKEERWPSKYCHLPLQFADGDPILSDLASREQVRLPPERPDFLLECPENKELLEPTFTRSEAPFQQTSVNKCSAQARNLMPTPPVEDSTCKCQCQMGNTTRSYPSLIRAPLQPVPLWTQDVPCAVQRPELWSPAFVPQMKAGAKMRGGQPVSGHKGARSQDCQQDSVGKKLRPDLQPHLLSPEDLVRKWSHQTTAEGEEREHGARKEMVLQRKLEVELRHIQQQMQYYYSRKQELKSCQQQARILRRWLETSTPPEDQGGVQGAQEELAQLQMRIHTLTKAQLGDRHHVQKLVARLNEIEITLNT
ncbi:LOW QUALITY PROTEIN: protein SFI1 homolog [Porphyrio hochstetteri]